VRVRIKFCCIASERAADAAIELGADALGLVSAMPSGPGVISEADIRAIAASVPPPIGTFLLTSLVDPWALAEQYSRCLTTTVQLCDALPREARTKLREICPGIRIVQVVHVRDEGAIAQAVAASDDADALLLDSGNPGAATRELGGTGRTHDWTISAEIRRRVPVPVFLAGGLNASNVAAAIHQVRPFGVDVCSGIRRDGALDLSRARAFVDAVMRTSSGLS
jgi:phosphoribosylanthranilate isomerase